jgi:hypothetical protein
MKFEEALKCMREGKKVRSKSDSHNPNNYIMIGYKQEWGENIKTIIDRYNDERNITRSLFLEDWEVVEDDNK